MSVIIRLQNLPWSANALDIRRFFSGLSVPDGGVHIVGGDKGDAFIAFSTDEDARRAMLMDNNRLAANAIKLLLSSKTEMQNVIAVARGGTPSSAPSGPPPPAVSQAPPVYNAPPPHPQQSGGPPPPINQHPPQQQQRFGPPVPGGQPGFPPNQGPPPPYGAPGMGPPPQGPNMGGPPPQDQRQNMPPQYPPQQPPPQGMPPQMVQGRPNDRPPVWDGPPPGGQGGMPMPRDAPPADYGRRDMPPPPHDIDHSRDMPPPQMPPGYDNRGMPPRDAGPPPNQGYHNMGPSPVNGSHQMERPPPQQQGPPPDYRDERRGYRDDYQYNRERSAERERYESSRPPFDRRDENNRKRAYDGGSPFVLITRMPERCSYKDVRKFFSGLDIPRDGLKLINDRKGRRVGDAFIRFATVEAAEQALKLDGWRMEGFTVCIEQASGEEFDRAIDSYTPGRSPEREARPMNYDRGYPEIKYDQRGPQYEHGGPPPVYGQGGMGYEHGPGLHEPPMKKRRSLSPSEVRKGDSLCVVVKNLPFQIYKRDLFKFFSGLKFHKGDTSVHIEEGPTGKPKGIALIMFHSDKDVHRALSYHRKGTLGGRPIEVISIPTEEYNTRVARSMKTTPSDQPVEKQKERSLSKKRDDEVKKIQDSAKESRKSSSEKSPKIRDDEIKKEVGNDSKPDDKRYYCVELRGVPFSTNRTTIRQFFDGLEISNRGIHIVYKADGNAAGPAFVEFVTSEDCKKALEKDKQFIGKRYINVKAITKKEMMTELQTLQNKFGGGQQHRPGAGGPSVAQKVGKHGCVVGVQNLHFSATLEDILDFFRGFHPIADSVKMRYNQDGRPTGDAMIAFHERLDAEKAARQLNKAKLHNRIVSVYVV